MYISQKQWTQIEKPNTLITKEKVINEDFWCITILNENFFIRRNNKISLTGNCHDAFDKEVDGCRVINNAYGYKSEQNLNGYVNKLLIEVSCEEI